MYINYAAKLIQFKDIRTTYNIKYINMYQVSFYLNLLAMKCLLA